MGRIRIVSSANGKHPMLCREDIAALHKAWSETLSTDEVCSRLGISQSTLSQLIKIELIRAERGPDVDGCQQWRMNERQVEACLINIRANTIILPIDEIPESAVDLTTAAKMMAVIGGNASTVIRGVVYGSLVGYTNEPTPIICNLHFEPSEIKDCIRNIREEQGWLTREQIASIFRVKVTVVSRWIRRGLIEPVVIFGSMHYFDKKAIYRFQHTHVFTEEAARILGIGVLAVQKWARKGRLTPIAGGDVDEGHRYLFKRNEVERLSKALTHPRLCSYLGIRRQQLDQLIDSGIIEPISGPEVDEMGHYLFEKPSTELIDKLADMGIVERY